MSAQQWGFRCEGFLWAVFRSLPQLLQSSTAALVLRVTAFNRHEAPLRTSGCSRVAVFPLFFMLACSTGLAALPDLILNRTRAVRTLEVQTRSFSADECAVVEGCVRGSGPRALLLFDLGFANVGKGDLVVGSPDTRPNRFVQSPCHGHTHVRNMVTFQLLKLNGRPVLTLAKRAFCIRDTARFSSSAGPSRYNSCESQGLTAGWQDIYFKTQECQWLDVTGVPPGRYLLRIRVNPARRFQESNYSNNSITVPVRIPVAQ